MSLSHLPGAVWSAIAGGTIAVSGASGVAAAGAGPSLFSIYGPVVVGGVITVLGLLLSRKLNKIHVLVNSRLSKALAEIQRLRSELATKAAEANEKTTELAAKTARISVLEAEIKRIPIDGDPATTVQIVDLSPPDPSVG
jgi:hypothetical protein